MEISKSLAEPREDSSIALCLSWDTGLALCLSWEELLPIRPTRLGWVNSPPSHLCIPKIPADAHKRYLCHLSHHCGDVEPTGACVQPGEGGWGSLSCRAAAQRPADKAAHVSFL